MMNENKDKLEKAPNSLIFVSLASMYLDNGMIDEAIDLCQAGLEIEPQNEEAHLILARAEIEKGSGEQARKRLIDILERNPENSSAKELLEHIKPSVPEAEEGERVEIKELEIAEEKVIEAEKRDKEKEEKSEPDHGVMPVVVEETTKESGTEKDDVKKDESDVQLASEEQEDVIEEEKPIEEEPDVGEFDEIYVEKIKKITKIEGVINCFFRLPNGRIVKNPQLVGNIKELFPLLDSLHTTVKNTGERLKMGRVEIIMIEIEKGVFYIFERENADCFVISKHADNFGLLKVLVPKILSEDTQGVEGSAS